LHLITWSSDLALNISEIDDQHKQLVNIMNELFDAMMDGRGFDIIDDILNRLAEYADYHYAFFFLFLPQRGRASLTLSLFPIKSLPFKIVIASCASTSEGMSIKPKPFGFPLYLSLIILTDLTCPNGSKVIHKILWVAS